MTALFVMLPAYGHLNPTFALARQLETDGYRIVYAYTGTPDLAQSVQRQGFAIHWLQSQPFGVGFDEAMNRNRSESYLETLLDRFTDQTYQARTADWQRTLTSLKPDLILLDAFLSTDFVVLYPLIRPDTTRIVLLQTMLPTYYDPKTPPLTSSLLAKNTDLHSINRAWQRYYAKRTLRRWWDTMRFLGRSTHRIMAQRWQQNHLPDTHRLRYDKAFHVGIDNVPEWILTPPGLDFTDRVLQPFQQNVTPPAVPRAEELPPVYEQLLARIDGEKQTNPNLKLIYASLGTLTGIHTNARTLTRFWHRLREAVAAEPNWRLVVALGETPTGAWLTTPTNVFALARVPQLHLLAHADAFLTHGGLNSVQEARAAGVPMRVYPLNRKWDQPGNAARVVYHGLGTVGSLATDSAEIIRATTRALMEESENSSKF